MKKNKKKMATEEDIKWRPLAKILNERLATLDIWDKQVAIDLLDYSFFKYDQWLQKASNWAGIRMDIPLAIFVGLVLPFIIYLLCFRKSKKSTKKHNNNAKKNTKKNSSSSSTPTKKQGGGKSSAGNTPKVSKKSRQVD